MYCIFLKLVMKHRPTSVGIKTFLCNSVSEMEFFCNGSQYVKHVWYINIETIISASMLSKIICIMYLKTDFCEKYQYKYYNILCLKEYWRIGSCKIFVKLNIHIIKITNNFTRYSHTKAFGRAIDAIQMSCVSDIHLFSCITEFNQILATYYGKDFDTS